MFVRLLYESLRRQTRRKLLVMAAVALGAAVSTVMLSIATDIGDKMSRELRAYGANLVVTPEEDQLEVRLGSLDLAPTSRAYLNEADLPKIKSGFWRNNIVSFTPELPIPIKLGAEHVSLVGMYFSRAIPLANQSFTTGARTTFPWWQVTGEWPRDDSEDLLVGESLAHERGLRPGEAIEIQGKAYRVSGLVRTGGLEDRELIAPLPLAQAMAGVGGAVRKVFVSAVTKPQDAFARRNPDSLSPAERDRWFCSAYPQSIAYYLEQSIARSHAEPIRQVEENQGRVLKRIEGLMLLVTLAALVSSAIAVAAAMATAMFERRGEVGLMKALGARSITLATIFLSESFVLALIGGLAGLGVGAWLAAEFGRQIFGSATRVGPVVLVVIAGIAVLVTFFGSAVAIRRAIGTDPVRALRGEA